MQYHMILANSDDLTSPVLCAQLINTHNVQLFMLYMSVLISFKKVRKSILINVEWILNNHFSVVYLIAHVCKFFWYHYQEKNKCFLHAL